MTPGLIVLGLLGPSNGILFERVLEYYLTMFLGSLDLTVAGPPNGEANLAPRGQTHFQQTSQLNNCYTAAPLFALLTPPN